MPFGFGFFFFFLGVIGLDITYGISMYVFFLKKQTAITKKLSKHFQGVFL